MTPEESQLYVLKGMLAEMPAEDQERVNTCLISLRTAVLEAGDVGLVALAIVGLEMQIEEAKK